MNKNFAEFEYWNREYSNNKFNNSWYEYFYTIPFGLTREDYWNKKILDIGCGPMGSLEWVADKAKCFGIDPLSNIYYNSFDCKNHSMSYICGSSEKIPFPNCYFDYITSINSLDHVDDVEKSILEIDRVLDYNGRFLLIVEINHKPTVCEPQLITQEITNFIIDRIKLECEMIKLYGLEHKDNIFKNIKENILSDNNPKILLAMFKKSHIDK